MFNRELEIVLVIFDVRDVTTFKYIHNLDTFII